MLDDKFAATGVVLFGGNGVALNLGQKAEAKGLTVSASVSESVCNSADASGLSSPLNFKVLDANRALSLSSK
jgi:hypothetical protein